ncbi:MarR family winged helix-turn-helix transcriptional regulator [Kitasatospora sp. NPDC089913]|uniref:MarR family winged helix-turn-helix transcriptional regulator n=1 Tax=Kitasatospora sp. NPDC089913 TaxID=3364080 RepID=UPI0038184C23
MGNGLYDGRKGSSSPFEQTVYLLSEAGRAVDRLLAERLEHRGLTPAHQSLLSTLATLGPHGRRDLVERLAMSGADAHRALDDLLSRGLLQSTVVHIGGRQELLAITDPGRAALDLLHSDAAAAQDSLLAALTRGQRVELNSLLRRVCAAAARGAGGLGEASGGGRAPTAGPRPA